MQKDWSWMPSFCPHVNPGSHSPRLRPSNVWPHAFPSRTYFGTQNGWGHRPFSEHLSGTVKSPKLSHPLQHSWEAEHCLDPQVSPIEVRYDVKSDFEQVHYFVLPQYNIHYIRSRKVYHTFTLKMSVCFTIFVRGFTIQAWYAFKRRALTRAICWISIVVLDNISPNFIRTKNIYFTCVVFIFLPYSS